MRRKMAWLVGAAALLAVLTVLHLEPSVQARPADEAGGPSLSELLTVKAGRLESRGLPAEGTRARKRLRFIDRNAGYSLTGDGALRDLKLGESRVIDLDTLERLLSADADGDGKKLLEDRAGENPHAQSRRELMDRDDDGYCAWQDVDDRDPNVHLTGNPLVDQFPKNQPATELMKPYRSRIRLIEAFLQANERERLFPQDEVLARIERTKIVPATVVERWRRAYLERPSGLFGRKGGRR